mmetsp:Transcript_6744/g.20488  ORF Transcript_6744/g.20488 Transcript_6744/m.20488 type:complete len:400 (-) Transcript_6744:78-1277(-)
MQRSERRTAQVRDTPPEHVIGHVLGGVAAQRQLLAQQLPEVEQDAAGEVGRLCAVSLHDGPAASRSLLAQPREVLIQLHAEHLSPLHDPAQRLSAHFVAHHKVGIALAHEAHERVQHAQLAGGAVQHAVRRCPSCALAGLLRAPRKQRKLWPSAGTRVQPLVRTVDRRERMLLGIGQQASRTVGVHLQAEHGERGCGGGRISGVERLLSVAVAGALAAAARSGQTDVVVPEAGEVELGGPVERAAHGGHRSKAWRSLPIHGTLAEALLGREADWEAGIVRLRFGACALVFTLCRAGGRTRRCECPAGAGARSSTHQACGEGRNAREMALGERRRERRQCGEFGGTRAVRAQCGANGLRWAVGRVREVGRTVYHLGQLVVRQSAEQFRGGGWKLSGCAAR